MKKAAVAPMARRSRPSHRSAVLGAVKDEPPMGRWPEGHPMTAPARDALLTTPRPVTEEISCETAISGITACADSKCKINAIELTENGLRNVVQQPGDHQSTGYGRSDCPLFR